MRIIKEGRKPAKEIEQTCERQLYEIPERCDMCGCMFTYTEQDIPLGMYRWVDCPCCGVEIELAPLETILI